MLQTLRQRITLWYTALFLVLSLVLVVSLNIIASQYYLQTKMEVDALSGEHYQSVFTEPIENRIRREQIIELIDIIRQEDLQQIRITSVILFLVLGLLSFIGGHYIAGDILKPIQDLNKQIQQIQVEDLQTLTYPHKDRDMQELMASLNDMLLRLGNSFRSQREFIEHASHELKTPLSVLTLQLESLKEDADFDEYQTSMIDQGLNTVMQLNLLLESLMILSLNKEQLQFQEIEIRELLSQSLNEANQNEWQYTISSKIRKKKKVVIKAVPELLQRAVENIIQNAYKYGGSEAKLDIGIQIIKKQVQLILKDNGPGIPKEDIHRVFDRFYRVDNSRSKKTGGRGLGLAITQSIIHLHGGTVRVKNHPEGGAEFTITLPVEHY